MIAEIPLQLARPAGRQCRTTVKRCYANVECQAASWDTERRVIAKIAWHAGELFPPVWVQCHQPADETGLGGLVLQPVRNGRTAFETGQARLPLGPAVVWAVPRVCPPDGKMHQEPNTILTLGISRPKARACASYSPDRPENA